MTVECKVYLIGIGATLADENVRNEVLPTFGGI